jgi:acyl-CoA oxidase
MPLLATTYALTFGLNAVKRKWVEQMEDGSDHNTVVRMCCAIKPMASWHLNKTVTVSRERCGGQGYLSINRFGDFFGSAHAGMTAEGDNSVLMQKVAKEHLSVFKPHKIDNVDNFDANNIGHLTNMLFRRENEQFDTLKNKIGKAMVFTKIGKKIPAMFGGIGKSLQEKGVFNTWMYQEQDLIQSFAKTYADRIICEAFTSVLDQDDVRGSLMEPILLKVFHLHLLNTLERDLSWFIENSVITPANAEEILDLNRQLCADLTPHALALSDAFGLPQEILAAPIAGDWVKYNAYDNQGELSTKEEFKKMLNKA